MPMSDIGSMGRSSSSSSVKELLGKGSLLNSSKIVSNEVGGGVAMKLRPM